jgi:hypothetical protein
MILPLHILYKLALTHGLYPEDLLVLTKTKHVERYLSSYNFTYKGSGKGLVSYLINSELIEYYVRNLTYYDFKQEELILDFIQARAINPPNTSVKGLYNTVKSFF